uniref:AP complex subunit sigma n=1 Tax=Arcella intermedia TaxID=1963864 RepID=A0A6B2LMV1_9EUKA
MIKAIMVINNDGKPRVTAFYENMSEEKEKQLIREIFKLLSKRTKFMCNFVEGGPLWGKNTKIIYRQYATLFFVFWVDDSESELGILDLIQVLVESLDNCFENVCELDIIFNMDKVHFILKEIVMGGMVLETDMQKILQSYREQQDLNKKDSIDIKGGVEEVWNSIKRAAK